MPTQERSSWRTCLLIIGIALAVRIAFTLQVQIPLQGDAYDYYLIASNLIHHGIYSETATPSAHRPPVYPMVLAAVSWLADGGEVRSSTFTFINYVCDIVSLFLLLILARRIGLKTALPGVVLVSLSPFWFGHISSAVTEPISVTLFLAFLERWSRSPKHLRDFFWSGIFMGLAILTRGIYIVFPLCLFGIQGLLAYWKKRPPITRPVLLFVAASYLLPFAWGLRNWISVGDFTFAQPVVSTFSMYWSMESPLLDMRRPETQLGLQKMQYAPYAKLPVSEQAKMLQDMKADFIDFVLDHPLRFLENTWLKFCRLWVTGWWNPYSYVTSSEDFGPLYIWVFCIPILLFGFYGLLTSWRERTKEFIKDPNQAEDPKLEIATVALLSILYVSVITIPVVVDSRYTIASYILLGLWVGDGWKKLIR